jgi:hypothetical protein
MITNLKIIKRKSVDSNNASGEKPTVYYTKNEINVSVGGSVDEYETQSNEDSDDLDQSFNDIVRL